MLDSFTPNVENIATHVLKSKKEIDNIRNTERNMDLHYKTTKKTNKIGVSHFLDSLFKKTYRSIHYTIMYITTLLYIQDRSITIWIMAIENGYS